MDKLIGMTDQLGEEIFQLAKILKGDHVPLIVGGGYGLILKQRLIENSRQKTLRGYPNSRSTDDLDIFLSVEFVTDATSMEALREALYHRRFSPIEGAAHYQFKREILIQGKTRDLKVDLLAPPPRDARIVPTMKIDSRRIRPRSVKNIHAHATPEAFSVAEQAIPFNIGKESEVTIQLPHPFSYLILKLFAYRDQHINEDKDFGRYHAFDIYRIVAMMTEDEFGETIELCKKFMGDEIVVEARRILTDLFSDPYAKGVLAIREYASETDYDLPELIGRQIVEDLKSLLIV